MLGFATLVRRHRVDPGPLVHVGNIRSQQIPAYYEAGFYDITVVESIPEQVRMLRTRFPGVDVQEVTGNKGFRLDATAPAASVVVIDVFGHELDILEHAPWDGLRLLVVGTTTTSDSGASPCDLVIEAVTTRGFVEVDRQARSADQGVYVVFAKIAE